MIPKILVKDLKAPQPISIGIPFPKGRRKEKDPWALFRGSKAYPSQLKPLSFWPDGSVKWALLDFIADHEGYYELSSGDFSSKFRVSSVSVKSPYEISLKGKKDLPVSVSFGPFSVEENGPIKRVFKRQGKASCRKQDISLEIFEYLIFFPELDLFRLEITLRNPRRAKHKGGYWDLGDPGSMYLRDFSLLFYGIGAEFELCPAPEEEVLKVSRFVLYQESSGGENWFSENHVNRFGKVPLEKRGFSLTWEQGQKLGLRARPLLWGEKFSLAFPEFWENFPKTLSLEEGTLRVGLLPEEFPDWHEIQGGEQKTHIFYFAGRKMDLSWVYQPAKVSLEAAYVSKTRAVYWLPSKKDFPPLYKKMTKAVISGEHSFFAKREIIDEYGWRNFGDVYADHENAFNKEDKPIISHYNNQYDLVYSFLIQFLLSGDWRWFSLADSLARHVYDIDIYHTREDKPAYNNGLFWHTFHYVNAYRATHRCYSKDAGIVGGGPSNEHLYSSGLLLHYFLTGDERSREAVINFAEHVIEMDGPYPFLAWFDKTPSGLATQTRDPWYHGPGRGAANSINCLLDAFLLTHKELYLSKAEEFIRRSIHPADDQEALGLRYPEERWSYTVFLQVLGKYLFLKAEQENFDFMFAYARESLLHYARWMVENEYFYLERPELLEYPTETWAAQEIRKAEVFNLAAYFSNNEREKKIFREKAKFFYETSLKKLYSFPTWYYTRPLAIILQSGFSYPWFKDEPSYPWPEERCDFGEPQKFIPQKEKFKRLIQKVFFFGRFS